MSTARAPVDRRAAMIGAATVIAANLLYLAGLPLVLDPIVSMDPFYIDMAQHPAASILREDPAWGPLYAMWLKPFVAALGDPLAVYAANLYALSAGVSLLIFVYVLLLTRWAAYGVGAALFFLVCDLNVPLSNKASAFALLVVLAALTASELAPAGARRMTVAAAGVLLASYVRPELYPAALCTCGAAIWLAYKESGRSGATVLLWPAAGLAMLLTAAAWIGTPLGAPVDDSSRLLIAFREHFAWNWGRWHDAAPDFLVAWQQEFGGARSLLEAVLHNPVGVAHHLADNLAGTVTFMAATAFDHYPVLAPATRPALVNAERLAVSTVVIGSVIAVAGRPALRRELCERYGHALFVYAAVGLCSLAAATAIFPLAHYLVMPAVLLMLTGCLASTLLIPSGPGFSWRTGLPAALVCLAAVPKPFVLPSAYDVPGSPFKGRISIARSVTDTIEFIRSLQLPTPVRVLTFKDGVGQLLGAGFHEIRIWEKGTQPLETYVRDNDVGMIISLGPGQESVMVNDREWQHMRSNLDAIGFVRVPVPNHDGVGVYVRSDLMQRRGD
jgi:hypothetical protein